MRKLVLVVALFELTLVAAVPLAQAHNLGPIVLGGSIGASKFCPYIAAGAICGMDQNDATTYCNSIHSRLPTVRELALFAKEHGAKGIYEIDVNPHDRISTKSEVNGTQDVFYYDYTGYKPTEVYADDQLVLWSSSVNFEYQDFAYGLLASRGVMIWENRIYDMGFAVRCVK